MRWNIPGAAGACLYCAVLYCQPAPAQPNEPAFEAASIRPYVAGAPGSTGRTGIQEDPGQIRIENLSLRTLVAIAFRLQARDQLSAPAWLDDVAFEITAKPPGAYKHDQLAPLLHNLLAERFKLSVHNETRPLASFALVAAKGGPKLTESQGPKTFHTGRSGLIEGNQWSLDQLSGVLARLLGHPVFNRTGLSGLYDLKLTWTPDPSPQPVPDAPATEPELSLFTAIQEQLGLRLEAQKIPGAVVVVDHIERTPTEN